MQDIASRWRGAYPLNGNSQPVDVFNPQTTPFPRPLFGPIERDYQPWDQKQYGVYGTLRMDLAAGSKLIVGARANKYRYDQIYWEAYDSDGNRTDTLQLSDATRYKEPTKITPFAGVIYDIDPQWTAYASYAQIFNPQYGSKAGPAPGTGLPPVRGSNVEAGLKGELFDGKVNTGLAVYRTVQDKQAITDPRYPFSSELYAGSCCYTASGKVISEGVDMELAGEVLNGLNLSTGYTYNHNRNETSGAAFSTITPKHLLKIWGTWRLPAAGGAWTVGGGANIQSTQYVSGTAATYNPVTQKFNGPSLPFRYTQAGYAVWNALVNYRIDSHWSMALNLNNVFDKTYYRTVGSSAGGNYYGTPRSASLTLRGQY
jgi:outer membrane receptor for ferric coprogen and ferric-rhodotorulic acid